MLFALNDSKSLIQPTKSEEAVCPGCLTPVVAKMGRIMPHHWAHKSLGDCEDKQLTQWHCDWILKHKDNDGWLVEYREENMRYDCFHPKKNLVVEFQNSSNFEYLMSKTERIIRLGRELNWVFSQRAFPSSMGFAEKNTYCRINRVLSILVFLEEYALEEKVNFYVDHEYFDIESKCMFRRLAKLHPEANIDSCRSGYIQLKVIGKQEI